MSKKKEKNIKHKLVNISTKKYRTSIKSSDVNRLPDPSSLFGC